MKTFKKALIEKINESSERATPPAAPLADAVLPVGTPVPLVWATPYIPSAIGPSYVFVEAIPVEGSL